MIESIRSVASAVGAVVERDFRVYISYRFTFVSQVFQALFSVTLFYYVSRLVNLGGFGSPDQYFAFAVVGVGLLQLLSTTLGVLPSALRQELVAGTFERLVLSPLGAVGGIAAMMIFPLIVSVFSLALIIAFAAIAFGMPIHWETVWLTIPIAVFMVAAFAPVGLLMGAAVVATKQGLTGANMVIALLSLVGGFYFPVALLPGWIKWASEVQPFTPALDLFRHAIVNTPLHESAWLAVAKLLGSAILLGGIAFVAMRAAVRRSRRLGTIIEY
jgi:ABC-2 type transport system permease protein